MVMMLYYVCFYLGHFIIKENQNLNYKLKSSTQRPFLICIDNIVTDVNNSFINLTGYSDNEIIGKSLTEISRMIRIGSQINLKDIQDNGTFYIFNKLLEAIEVYISCKNLHDSKEKTLSFEKLLDSGIKEKFNFAEQLYTERKTGVAIIGFPDLILLKANQNFLNLLDEPYNKMENSISKKQKEIVTGYEGNMGEELWDTIINTGKPYYAQEFQYNNYKRGVTYRDTSIVPIFIEGELRYFIRTYLDVTERVLDRKLLEEQKKELEAIIENISEEFIVFDKNGEYIKVNKASRENPLYNIEKLKGSKDTYRLKKEENIIIQTHYDLLNKIIENLDLGFARCSYPDFKILDMNNKFYEILIQINPELGSPLSIKGEDAFNIAYGKGRGYKTEVVENFEKGHSTFLKIRKTIIAGKEKFYKILYQQLRGFNNQIIEVIVVLIDVTEEVKDKNKMEEALKMQEDLFANVSHELKTPLNVIFSSSQLMEFYLKNDSLESNKGKILKNVNIIKQNCYRFTKLINNIIDLSKIDSGFFKLNLSNENIVDVIDNIVSSVSEYVKAKDLNIIFDTDVEEKIIAVDADKIERIMLNLISNAIKFSNPGSTIYVNVADKGDFIEISVKDSGIGIGEEHLSCIFERFHQVDKSLARNSEGSGIGLFLVKSIIDLHGGKINVESEVNKGSLFKIELPAKAIDKPKVTMQIKPFNNKIEMIQIEFSDIYSI